MPANRRAPEMTDEMLRKCRHLVYEAAIDYDVPPVFITAHIRNRKADEARKHVMRQMITELGMARYQVAKIFNRDLRRVRKSVLGV